MMISAEKYYQINLKGKSQHELLELIERLKKRISNLKRVSFETPKTYPSKATMLIYNREYLDRAIQAYEEAGGTYIPTEEEQKDAEFNAKLDHISKIVFTFSRCFREYDERTIILKPDRVLLNTKRGGLWHVENCLEYELVIKDELISGLKNLRLYDWEQTYDEPAMDGTTWNLEIYFNNDKEPLQYCGSNLYPYNFESLRELLGFEEEFNKEIDKAANHSPEDDEFF